MSLHWSFRHIRPLSFGFILVAVAMLFSGERNPQNIHLPEGYRSPILALEFATNPEEVETMFQSMSIRQQERLTVNTKTDFLFLIVYGALLFGFSIACLNEGKSSIFLLGTFLSLGIMAGDVLENIQLLKIIQNPYHPNLEQVLFYLQIYTWLKWGLLGLIFALFSLFFFSRKWWEVIFGILLCIPLMLGIMAFFGQAWFVELFFLSISVSFLLIVIYTFIYRPTKSIFSQR